MTTAWSLVWVCVGVVYVMGAKMTLREIDLRGGWKSADEYGVSDRDPGGELMAAILWPVFVAGYLLWLLIRRVARG